MDQIDPYHRDPETYELSILTPVLDIDSGLSILLGEAKRPVFDILLDIGVVQFSSYESLGVKHSVARICMKCVLCALADPG